MQLSKDVREFIELLNSNSVDLVTDGVSSTEYHAVGYHGFPRMTGDFDFFVRSSAENAQRLIEVFREFGFDNAENLLPALTSVGRSIKIGAPPDRIDVITGISGVDFGEAWATREPSLLGGVPVAMIGKEALVKNKKASGRPKDLLDIAELERLNPK